MRFRKMTTVNNLFNQLPNGFFNLLASNSNNQIYADCLELIFREYEREVSYRIPRDRIRDAIAIYIAENHIKALDEVNDQSPNDIASRIIYKFLDSNIGWLEEEIDDVTYERQIIMTEQGVLLAEFLMNLKRPEKAEFASYIFDIYNTLNNKEQWQDNPYAFALKSVYRNAKALAKSLKRLSTYMKKYIEQMVHEETLESLTNNLLEYSTGNFIHEYARLTKQSNIHLYRQSINKKLRQLRTNKELFELLVIGCFDEEELANESEAEEFVIDLIDNTNRFLNQDYDEILRDIKNKITLYLDIAIGRARFIQNKEADARGKVEQVLKYIATEMESLGMKEEIPEEMTSLFAMDSQEFMDLQSLRYPRKAQPIRKATVDLYEEMTEEDRERARMLQEHEAYNPYARELMKQYIEQQLQGRTTMTSEELPLSSRRDVLAAVSAAAYGDQNGYDIIMDQEPEYEDKGEFVLRKFTIKKRANV
ncbi:Wadjet anti-phage system protein JetA family protein [Oribacterium sp. FC2011]|uniref:Wadjet anti-phage system protein JetA family protein n=1 Tax=Oribacterium sp. FC2011 TaxID=1408311 RepID=UPI0012DD64E2|nr:Wadjet anti-phage system protein JetA family protein [Oribacterium sp. FC2011]